MEQQFLYIKKGRKKVRSRRFDFEAMCKIDDNREKEGGVLKIALDCLFYMFEDTEILPEDIKKLSSEQLTTHCTKLFLWYHEVLMDATKDLKYDKNANQKVTLREIYRKMFSAFGVLPGALMHQDPQLLLYAMQTDEREEIATENIPAEVKVLYGL